MHPKLSWCLPPLNCVSNEQWGSLSKGDKNATQPILRPAQDDNSQQSAWFGGASHDILVYPNPAQQILHVQLPEGAQRFSISDLSGRVLASYNAGQQQVNISKLREGMYLISTEINGKKYTVRFVKE